MLAATSRPDQFRPFIPYTLVYAASGMALDVQFAQQAAGTPLWQYTPNGTDAQSFRFEDAGNGFVHIRTLAGLYLTADDVAHGPNSPAAIRVRQERKIEHGPNGGTNVADRQRWNLAPSPDHAHHPDDHTVSCAAYPHRVLQPAHKNTGPGMGVALGQPSSHSPSPIPNPWTVTSPRLP